MKINKLDKNIFKIILISFIFVIPLFIFKSVNGDFITHISRIYNLNISFQNNEFNPYMYQSCYYKYGYPFGIFYPDTFLKPFALLTRFGMSIYISSILLLFTINIATFITPYIFLKKENVNLNKAFTISLLYFIYPYRFIDFIHRFSIGELFFFIFFPFIIYGFYEIFYKKKFSIYLTIGFYGIVHSHILSIVLILIFCIITFIYLIYKTKFYKSIYYILINAFISISICLDVIIPIIESQIQENLLYEFNNSFQGTLYDNTYKFINSTIITTIIGFCIFIGLIIISILDKNKKRKCIYILISLLLIQTNLFNWDIIVKIIPQLNIIQFPFRFLVYGSLFWTYLLYSININKLKKYIVNIFLIFEFIISILLCFVYEQYNYDEMFFNIGAGDYINTNVDIKNLSFFDLNENRDEDITKNIYLCENGYLPIFYYHNYVIKDNKNKEYQYTNKDGLIYIEELKNNNITLNVFYQKTLLQQFSYYISIINIILLLITLYKKHNI